MAVISASFLLVEMLFPKPDELIFLLRDDGQGFVYFCRPEADALGNLNGWFEPDFQLPFRRLDVNVHATLFPAVYVEAVFLEEVEGRAHGSKF